MNANTRRFIMLTIFGLAYTVGQSRAEPKAAEIWMAPLHPIQRPNGALAGSTDYDDLFTPDAPWSSVAGKVSVFKIYPDFLRKASDDELRRMIANLSSRHIALALETPVLISCDAPAEKTEKSVPWMVKPIERLKSLGGDLRYLAMVGPLVDGHVFTVIPGCPRAIPDVAAAAWDTVAYIRRLYPDIAVGEIEPTGQGSRYPDWSELGLWFDAWQKASGRPLAFLHMDTQWAVDWAPDMLSIGRQTRDRGIKFGVIYDGNEADLSDEAFAQTALAHADALEALLAGPPDQAVFQSWVTHPRKALPETSPDTMTGIVKAYLRPRSRITADATKLSLRREDGTPIDNADIVLEEHDPGPAGSPLEQSIDGIAPHDTTSAAMVVRVHDECFCAPANTDLALGDFRFHQTPGSGQDFQWDLRSWTNRWAGVTGETDAAGASLLQIVAAPAQKLIMNGPTFAVIPDQPFSARFLWRVEPRSENTGYVALIFFGPDGKERHRTIRFLRANWRPVAHLQTDSHGSADISARPHVSGASLRLRYPGDLEHRPTTFDLPDNR
jgi:hypothetical protein